jgi:replicative DNA helicase
VLEWLIEFQRKHGQHPSMSLFRERWVDFRMEPSSDTLASLLDAFFARVKRRVFSAKVSELAHAEQDPAKWARLDEIMLEAAHDLATVVPTGKSHRFSDMHKRIDLYEEEAANPQQMRSYKMGIDPFDEVTGGMRPGNLVTIAGPSGKGKSLMASWFVMNGYEQDASALMLILEMTAAEVFERLDTMVTHFSHKLLTQRDLPDSKVAYWRRIANQYSGLKNDIVIKDDLTGCGTERVYAEISRAKPDIVVVDYVQMMKSKQGYASQWQGLVEITNDLKQIAVQTDTVILMVSQDGRDSFENGSSETNSGGSISIYQAADIYVGMHQNDAMYDQGTMEVRLLKNRRGAKINSKGRSANLVWEPATMNFSYDDGTRPQSTAFVRN